MSLQERVHRRLPADLEPLPAGRGVLFFRDQFAVREAFTLSRSDI